MGAFLFAREIRLERRVAGMRCYLSNILDVYAEWGYTSGCVNAGITHRW